MKKAYVISITETQYEVRVRPYKKIYRVIVAEEGQDKMALVEDSINRFLKEHPDDIYDGLPLSCRRYKAKDNGTGFFVDLEEYHIEMVHGNCVVARYFFEICERDIETL